MSLGAPKVTVCCVAYQQRSYIEETLQAIMMQRTDFPVEVIVHDDGSKDGTAEIIARFRDQYPERITAVLQRDNQYSQGRRPRKLCWGMARGEYIAFCDGDDVWTDPLKLQKQADLLDRSPGSAGCFHWAETHVDGRFNGKVYGGIGERAELTTEDFFRTMSPVHISSLMVRKVPLVFPEWYTRVHSTDIALMSMVSAFGPLLCIPEVMSIYRKHDGGMAASSTVIKNLHRNRIRLMQHLNAYHGHRFDRQANAVIAEHRVMLAAERGGGITGFLRRIVGAVMPGKA